jgi:hypothetical protein
MRQDAPEYRQRLWRKAHQGPLAEAVKQRVEEGLMKAGVLVAVTLLTSLCANPVPFTATFFTSASLSAVVGERAQLVVKVTNTGPLIPHLGLVFRTADKWYERHTLSDLAGCTIASDTSAFDCGDLGPGDSVSFVIVGTAKDAGTFHYELALRSLVRPFEYVNNHSDGAEVQVWDETVTAK